MSTSRVLHGYEPCTLWALRSYVWKSYVFTANLVSISLFSLKLLRLESKSIIFDDSVF
jgi:hypothetical protein